jgi:DNA-binding PadR family transcriptional regulator
VNLPALREIGFSANRRLLGAQRLDHDPIAGVAALDHVTKPLTTNSGTRVSGLPLGDPRSQALLHALEMFRLTLPGGFRNPDLRTLVAQLRGWLPGAVTPGQMTYDLRRLREHGLIERLPHTNRYRITDLGLRVALLITRVQERVLPTGLAHLLAPTPTTPRLRAAAHAYETAIDELVQQQLAA